MNMIEKYITLIKKIEFIKKNEMNQKEFYEVLNKHKRYNELLQITSVILFIVFMGFFFSVLENGFEHFFNHFDKPLSLSIFISYFLFVNMILFVVTLVDLVINENKFKMNLDKIKEPLYLMENIVFNVLMSFIIICFFLSNASAIVLFALSIISFLYSLFMFIRYNKKNKNSVLKSHLENVKLEKEIVELRNKISKHNDSLSFLSKPSGWTHNDKEIIKELQNEIVKEKINNYSNEKILKLFIDKTNDVNMKIINE